MYNCFSNKRIENESLANIIHFIIGVLIKYKFSLFSNIPLNALPNAPKGSELEVAHEFFEEIDAKSLVGNKDALNIHIQNLYELLKNRMETSLKTSNENANILLNRLRDSE